MPCFRLRPLTTNLVVADESRTDKTICLAVSPALKAFGVPGRPRLFQVKEVVQRFNRQRAQRVLGKRLVYSSIYRPDILHNPAMGLDFVIAKPRMELYEDVSAKIFGIYLNYIAPEDIHVYLIDEAFIDATGYLTMYDCTALTPPEFYSGGLIFYGIKISELKNSQRNRKKTVA